MRSPGALLALVLALTALLFGAMAVPSAAEHTPEHRYFVTGTVTDTSGNPVCGVAVSATDATVPGSEVRTDTTDGSGRYSIQLHMHSLQAVADQEAATDNEGDTIRVSAEGVSRDVLAVRNGNNPVGWGQQTVPDLTVSGVPDRCGWGGLVLPLGIVAAVFLSLLAVVWLRRRPRKLGGGPSKALMGVPGVTRARARELGSFGIRSVKELAETDPKDLSKNTNLTPKEARLLVKRAQEFVRNRET